MDAAEVTAFAHRGEKFDEQLGMLTQILIDGLQQLRPRGRAQSSDVISEIAAVNAMAFVGNLGADQVNIPFERCQTFFQGQAELDSAFSIQAARASSGLSKLTGHKPAFRSRIDSMSKLIAFPIPIVGQWHEAGDSIPIWKYATLLFTLVISEVLMVLIIGFIISHIILAGMPSSIKWTFIQVFWPSIMTISIIWCVARFAIWAKSPTKAYYVIAPLQMLYAFVFLLFGYTIFIIVVSIRSLPEAVALVIGALRELIAEIPEFFRWLWGLTRFWRQAMLTAFVLGAVGGLLWAGTSLVIASLATSPLVVAGSSGTQTPDEQHLSPGSLRDRGAPPQSAKPEPSRTAAIPEAIAGNSKANDECADLLQAKSRLERIRS